MTSNIIKEGLIENQPSPVDLEGTRKIFFQMEKSICKIYQNGKKGTGFFCQIPFPDKNNLFYALITNNHILNQKDIEDNKIIKITMYSSEEKKNIEKEIIIDESRKRYTYINDQEGIDFTIIEIKPIKDKIRNFLQIDEEILELECNRKSIYLLHYPKDKKLVSYGLIKGIIDGKKIIHYCNTEEGSSGSPILSLNNYRVIGVHYGGSNKMNIKFNYGTYIKYIINEFNNIYKDEIKKIIINRLKKISINNSNLAHKSNIRKRQQINKIVTGIKPVFNKAQLINFYDVIVNIKSIKDLNKGWFVKLNNDNYKKYKNEKTIIIGIIGNSNKGKTFLVSKISKEYLPSEIKIKTKGLNIKYPKLSYGKMALLDIEGLETSILKEEEKEEEEKDNLINLSKEYNEQIFKEKSADKSITEIFLQNYIVYNSNIIIIVVGILTHSEQKLINRIRNEISRKRINKPLFIIHNLMTYTTEEQVEDYIKEVLLKSVTFNLEEGDKTSSKLKTKSGKYFYEKYTNNPVYHLLFANEDSKAGNLYNELTLQFLEDNYHNVTDIKHFDVVKTIKDRFTEISKNIIQEPETIIFDDSKEEIIKLDCIGDIKFQYGILGYLGVKSNDFEPAYNFYKKGDKIVIRIEAPGNCELLSSKIDFLGEITYIKIFGKKKEDKEPRFIHDNLYNERKTGPFSLDIPFSTEYFLFKNENPSIQYKKGVFILEYQLENKKNETVFKNDKEDEDEDEI